MTVSVIELDGSDITPAFWKRVMFFQEWKTDYLMLRGLTYEDGIMFLN